MAGAALWFALAGCGRVGYDPLADGVLGDGSVGGDPLQTVEDSVPLFVRPALVWNGLQLGLAWAATTAAGESRIYFRQLDRDGSPIGDPVTVSSLGGASEPSMAWTGSHYAIAWQVDTETGNAIRIAFVDVAGTLSGSQQVATGFLPALAWTGAELGLLWLQSADTTGDVRLMRLDAAGGLIAEVTVETNEPWSIPPYRSGTSLAWGDGAYAAGYDVYRGGTRSSTLMQILTDGTSSPLPMVNANYATVPQAIKAPGGIAATWVESQGFGAITAWFRRYDGQGAAVTPQQSVFAVAWDAVVADADPGYAVVGQVVIAGQTTVHQWTLLDSDGNELEPPIAVTGESEEERPAQVAGTGSGFAMVWPETVDGVPSLRFRPLP